MLHCVICDMIKGNESSTEDILQTTLKISPIIQFMCYLLKITCKHAKNTRTIFLSYCKDHSVFLSIHCSILTYFFGTNYILLEQK